MSSTKEQMDRVIEKYYKSISVYLLKIDLSKLSDVRFEPITNGDIYPHQYGTLPFNAVLSYELVKKE